MPWSRWFAWLIVWVFWFLVGMLFVGPLVVTGWFVWWWTHQ